MFCVFFSHTGHNFAVLSSESWCINDFEVVIALKDHVDHYLTSSRNLRRVLSESIIWNKFVVVDLSEDPVIEIPIETSQRYWLKFRECFIACRFTQEKRKWWRNDPPGFLLGPFARDLYTCLSKWQRFLRSISKYNRFERVRNYRFTSWRFSFRCSYHTGYLFVLARKLSGVLWI